MSLKGGVAHLELEDAQWLELLKLRTAGLARNVVDRACILQGELTLEETVLLAWEYLDQQFQTQKRPSQQILSTLQCRPQISSSNPNELTAFSQHCESALCIMRSKPGTLASLNEQTTQDMIVNRLSPDLNQKWYDHRYERLKAKGAVSFEKFAEWI